jgi:predicted anti-sigma-YlaC factor YlaD
VAAGVALALLAAPACSMRRLAVNKVGDALAAGGDTYASDDDPELVGDALPFSLKLMESLLAESPRHRGLLTALARGFTQYSWGWVQQEGDAAEERDLDEATRHWDRARKLYLRARDYGLRGLATEHPELSETLRRDPGHAVAGAREEDVELLYWTAVSWAAAIGVSKDDPDLVADLPLVDALIGRALALDESFDSGAIHSFLITFGASRGDGGPDAAAAARRHLERALELSDGRMAGPLVAFAESVAVPQQDRTAFEELLGRALAIDPDARPEWRLPNLIHQRRARWLLDRGDRLFLD